MLKLSPLLIAIAYALLSYRFSVWRTKAMLDRQSRPLTDPAITAMADRLAAALDLPAIKVHVFEIEPVNGLAAPDGRIFLTRGFLNAKMRGEVTPDALRPIERAMRDERLRLPDFKISVGSATPERSKLRLAVKGAHLGLAVYLCELAGLETLALRRIRLGRVSLGDLEEGTWRYLGEGERF